MSAKEEVRDAFPELDEIEDDELRQSVVDLWAAVLEESTHDDLKTMPWWPAYEQDVGVEYQVDHVRDVTACAIAIADVLSLRRDISIDRDTIVAAALLHDISKPLEMTIDGTTQIHEWLSHPHYGLHLLAQAGFSLHIQHIMMAHSTRTGIEPQTLEAQIIWAADDIAAHSTFVEKTGHLKTVTR